MNLKHGDLEGILNRGCPTVLPQANLQQPRRCSVSNDIGILLAGCARRWPPALWWDLPLICHGRWLLPAPRSHRAQFEPFQKSGPNPLLEIYLGSRERGERRAQGQAWHGCADKDDWVWSTQTIMASEKWGYLLSIPNEGNHRLYIVLFMAGQGLCVRVPGGRCEAERILWRTEKSLSLAPWRSLSFYFEWVHSDLFSQPDSFVFLLNYPGCATWTHLSMSLSVCWS